ncbi:MAG: ABC transporter ATP-binding protein, partial [Thermodesulfobacteriota bacterium]
MAVPIIEVKGISKRYSIGKKESYGSLREEIMSTLAAPFRRKSGDAGADSIWALRDVSFDVAEGEILGVIGRNGAGKSTLLKILSRITEPTEGRITMRGRVASLLEVGTGFHPELTGRENIFLNGALLGMTSREIKAKFDEIVAFSEIEKFLDTPVKRYSSGMYVRLAFAVAAHLEPEILIIDEVLAVGDASFQKKCLGKMGDVARGGRTVLFVSHNMAAVRSLCTSAMLIADGSLVISGSTEQVTETYLKSTSGGGAENGEVHWLDAKTAPGGREMRLESIRLLDTENTLRGSFDTEKPIKVEVTYRLFEKIRGMRLILQVINSEGVIAFASTDQNMRRDEYGPGVYRTVCTIPGGLLNSGLYFVLVHSGCPGVKVLVQGEEFIRFHAEKAGQHGSLFPEK